LKYVKIKGLTIENKEKIAELQFNISLIYCNKYQINLTPQGCQLISKNGNITAKTSV
jgi:hypothetical protein